ncbi:MAG: 1-deoxy-D-xylulose-5-phosphate synthase [Phycisphaerales bacterium]|nr:1-deoxy-D-xylulose-5-phosphate synthase [Phycisphaerales bacterium]
MPILTNTFTPQDLRKLPVSELPNLAREIREHIVRQISKSGGHLAPNLGVVELTLALHYVFDFLHDRLVFDVGHQAYPHKLITGRLALLDKLRTREGMSGFPEPSESPYDLFRVGHAGTGISTAVGLARGDQLNNESFIPNQRPEGRRIVTLIGDASIVNGVAMEGLNNAGTLNRQFLVVLNDNGMSISRPQGAVSQYFDRLRLSHRYGDFKKSARKLLEHIPGGESLIGAYHRAGEMAKAMVNEGGATGGGGAGGWFEHFGLLSFGPIDGHDLPQLIEFLGEARDIDRPMLLHVKTVKGKGCEFAESDSSRFHSPGAFKMVDDGDPDSERQAANGTAGATSPSTPVPLVSEGCRVEIKPEGRSFTTAFGDAMLAMMQRDPKVVACTAAMPDGTGISKVLPKFPERSWDVGICESHALDMMAGLAKTGFKPFLAVYCTFFQRAFDQAFQEAALQGLPVRLCMDRAGLVGGDGAVHHGFCDTALLRTLPGAAIMAAIDEPSLLAGLEFMRTFDAGLSSIRYPRDIVSPALADTACPAFELGKARLIHGPDVCAQSRGEALHAPAVHAAILAFGTPAIDAIKAARELAGEYTISIYDARFAKPIDTALIRELLTRQIPIITVEDHSSIGGFGSAVLEAAQEMALDASRITRMGLPDSWIMQDSRARQLAEAGIDAAGIARAIRHAAGGHESAAQRTSEPSASAGGLKRPISSAG